jgi:hypothetical protein
MVIVVRAIALPACLPACTLGTSDINYIVCRVEHSRRGYDSTRLSSVACLENNSIKGRSPTAPSIPICRHMTIAVLFRVPSGTVQMMASPELSHCLPGGCRLEAWNVPFGEHLCRVVLQTNRFQGSSCTKCP